MRVIGVDPGYERLGVAIVEYDGENEKLLHSECIETDKNLDLPDRLKILGENFTKVLQKHSPTVLAVETIFFNKNAKTAIGVAQARGIILYLAQTHNCKVYEFGPQEIKIAITGYGKSDKAAVIDMTKRLVKNAPKSALDDEYDAIAVGITCLAHYGRNQ